MRFGLPAALALAAGAGPAVAQSLSLEEHANVQMMIESVMHGVRMETESGRVAGDIELRGGFNGESWWAAADGEVGGAPLALDYTGELLEAPGGYESLVRGDGTWGADVWQSHIVGRWGVDSAGLLVTLDYEEVADDGGGLKPKWWVYAAEILAGGLVGGAGSLGAGAVTGAAAAVNISEIIDSKTAAPPEPPAPPAVPPLIELEPEISRDQIVVVVTGDGAIAANNVNLVRFRGQWSVDPTGVGLVVEGAIRIDAACFADFDRSGELDFFDFLAFQDAFARGSEDADCDDSGDLDFFDFLCFQTAFAEGC